MDGPKSRTLREKHIIRNAENEVTDTQYKRELLFRKANGKRIQEDYLNKIRALIRAEEVSYETLGLELSDDILRSPIFIHGEIISSTIRSSELSEFIASAMLGGLGYYVYLDDDWKYCGAFGPVKPDQFRNDFQFGSAILNDIIFVAENFDHAIAIDYYEVAKQFHIDITIHRNQAG